MHKLSENEIVSGAFVHEGRTIRLWLINVEEVQFGKNLEALKAIMEKIHDLEDRMSTEMFKLWKESWHREWKMDQNEFKTQLELYSVYNHGITQYALTSFPSI